MKILLYMGRAVLVLLGAFLAYAAVLGVMQTAAAAPWGGLTLMPRLFSQSLIVSIPAIPIGLVVMGVWPRLWAAPAIALLWTIIATIISDPEKFDFVFQWFLQLGGSN